MSETFEDRAGCTHRLGEVLGIGTDGSAVAKQALDGFVEGCEEQVTEAPEGRFEVRVGRWVVRDEDLKVLPTLKDAVLALAGAHFVFGDLTAASVTSLGFALLSLARNAYRCGATVTKKQAMILGALKLAGKPVSVASLRNLLEASEGEWDEGVLREELGNLSTLFTAGGLMKAVEVNNEGEWFLNGV